MHEYAEAKKRGGEKVEGEDRTLIRNRGPVLCGLISERIDLIRLLLVLGCLLISRAGLFLAALLGL